ncbi:MAG TPA: hypothetical protein VNV43_05560, partial [Candidatus Acidoferrales bacterium]|nr:hypothetical protein [Candidatus Acidoferrales bacterium]
MKAITRISSHSPGAAVCAVVMLALAAFRAQAGNDAMSDRSNELTGIYTQVAVGDPDFGGGTNAIWIL